MKNFKKIIILSIIIVVCIIFNFMSEKGEGIVEEDIYVENITDIETINEIILHITGEVNKPRNYKNKRRLKIG